MRIRHLLILAVLLVSPAAAQQHRLPEDHLEPEGSILGGTANIAYENRLRDVFRDAHTEGVVLQMTATPPFVSEYAVGIRSLQPYGEHAPDGKAPPYRIFGVKADAPIWNQVVGRAPAGDTKVSRCEIAISDGLEARIADAWFRVLQGTRFPTTFADGADGIAYHFTAFKPKLGTRWGQVWMPPRDSVTGNLVALGNTMRDVCNKQHGADMAALEKVTAELEHRLK
jgi:hypothetical protein